jgi:hypothetical protein
MAFVIGAVIGAGASLLGGAISAGATSDAIDAQTNASNQANALEREQFDYQKKIQQPYNTAGAGALGLISTGLGIAPQVETRDQIRARLNGQNGSIGSLGNPINSSNQNNSQAIELQKQLDKLLPIINSNSSSNYSDQAKEQYQKISQQLQGLQAQDRQGNNYSNTNNNIDAQVETEYQKQLDAQKSAQNGSGFGEFNKDFTAADFDINKDPGAVFRQQEAMKALSRTYAGSGNFLSGGALKGITKYNQDFASQEFGNAFDRFNVNKTNRFNRLATVAGIGQTSANAIGNAGQNYANNVGNNATNLGNSIGSASLYGGRQLNNAVQSGANSISNYLQNRIPTSNANIQGYGGTTADPWYG